MILKDIFVKIDSSANKLVSNCINKAYSNKTFSKCNEVADKFLFKGLDKAGLFKLDSTLRKRFSFYEKGCSPLDKLNISNKRILEIYNSKVDASDRILNPYEEHNNDNV